MASSLFRSKSLLQKSAMNASRSTELTGSWLRRINATATSPHAREAQGQLGSLLDFYNNPVKRQATKDIDWEGHKSRIHTPGVVDAIQAKYQGMMAAEYQVDAAVGMIGAEAAKMQELDVAMKYNYALYMMHYATHLEQIETVRNVGDMKQMSFMEVMKLAKGTEEAQSTSQEIADMAPDSYSESGMATRMCTQFSWGSKENHPFVHSHDTVSGVFATLGKLGK